MVRAALVLLGLFLVLPPALADVNVKTCAPEPEATPGAYGDPVDCEIKPRADSGLYGFLSQAAARIYIYLLRHGGTMSRDVSGSQGAPTVDQLAAGVSRTVI